MASILKIAAFYVAVFSLCFLMFSSSFSMTCNTHGTGLLFAEAAVVAADDDADYYRNSPLKLTDKPSTAAPEGRPSPSSSSSDSLGLAILKEYKALEEASKNQQHQQQWGSAANNNHPSYALGFPPATPQDLIAMSNKDLRQFIADRKGRCEGCVERRNLLERAMALRAVPSANEEVVAMLTPFATSAASHLTTDVLRPQSAQEVEAGHHLAMSNAVLRDPRYICDLVQRNDEAATSSGEKAHQQQQQKVPELSCRLRTDKDVQYV